MKKTVVIIISIRVAAAGLLWAGWFYRENLRGAGPALKSPAQDITKLLETTPPPSPAAPTPQFALTPQNRSVPTGYKVVRYKLDQAGNVLAKRTLSPVGSRPPRRPGPSGGYFDYGRWRDLYFG